MIYETPHLPSDIIKPTYRFDRNFNVKIPTREDWRDGNDIMNNDCLTLFSDGSKFNGPAGSGIHCPQMHVNKSFALGSFISIFQSETFGISQ